MIYVGHFSFDETGSGNNARHGYFSGLVQAADIDSAVERFKERILELKDKHEAMQSVVAVYIEDIVEFEAVPDRPVITRLQSCEGPFPRSISRSLPDSDNKAIQAYGFRPDVQTLRESGGENFQEMTPFLKF
ncbi:MAG TPA: hypothetical protein ACFCUC_10770 [Desulfobacterales bacterium]